VVARAARRARLVAPRATARLRAVASRRGEVRTVFRPWRANPIWIVAALLTPMALQLVAKLVELALGGQPSAWVYLPATPEHIAALVIFSVGEEFGWRGFSRSPASPRATGP
jgi:membrane protease YdiL (CAAX protease family)